MGDQFVDLVMIATHARHLHEKAGIFVAASELRKDAIRIFAEQEYSSGRFKTLDSANKTLHDACVRRLQPHVNSIDEFDTILEEWLRTGSGRLSKILSHHARTDAHRGLIEAFFVERQSPGPLRS